MEMKDFAEKVRAAAGEELGRDYKVEIKNVRKNNGVCHTGLIVLEKGRDTAPTIYLEDFLAAYGDGMSFSDIVSSIVRVCRLGMVKEKVDTEFFRHFESVRDRICYRLVGREGNGSFLEEIPHMEFLDLAVCFYYSWSDDVIGRGSILIYNSHMEMWGTSTEELYKLAEVNTPRLFPWMLDTLPEILCEAGEEDCCGELKNLPQENIPDIPMRVLTSSNRRYGAACVLYPGVLEKVAERMGGDFYVFPSSIHEVILMPCDGMITEEYMKTMISNINNTQVDPEEVLSNSLYCYDAQKKKLELV
ncbi:MAG TPA: hypothetical protein DCZ91_16835 [Lachnospiraceae bacterium]|nr:hypothetical protein [Lachnospiraceae bacterium]